MATYTGINIQYPISQLIISGKKTIETRTYPMPEKYIERELLMIETPGEKGEFRARIVGIIVFGKSIKYKNKTEFYNDFQQHFVDENSPYAWIQKDKWAWPIISFKPLKQAKEAPQNKGIRFTSRIEL